MRVGPQGRVVIPAAMRRALGIQPGQLMVARIEAGRLVLERREQVLSRLRHEVQAVSRPGVSVVDELIAERRAEARREEPSVER
jgi:AbrB family looped-hinge helix DNA binding protein